ncbi:MAG: preprotein translocase subunit SecE [Betaproteobacteria bacterium]|nr:preprotein translocase subunit SecE [Betaproteobacteria bacterium]
MTDKIKLAVALLLVVAGLGGYYMLAEHATVLRVLSVLAGVGAAVAVAWTTPTGQIAVAFTRESVQETRKVVWPTRKETIQTTGVVFALVVAVAIFLWIVDVSLLWLVKLVMGRSA